MPNDWLISWGCVYDAFPGAAPYPIQVAVYGANGSLVDAHAVNDTCTAKNRSNDGNEEHYSGMVYLIITCPGDWDVEILAPQ